jgi:hypothetical protein
MNTYSFKLYDFNNKDKVLFDHISEMLKITLDMFKWEGLPSTIPERELELLLQLRGSCIVASHNSDLYALGGNLSGECDAYYIPKYYIVANPWLKLEKTFERDVDCVFGVNDRMWTGLSRMMERYATQSLETDISLKVANIMERLHSLVRCANDSEKVAFETLLNRLEKGELASAIVSDDWALGDGLNTLPFAGDSHKTITELIELRQYIKASWYNELGLQANYNMKREAINSTEGQLNEDGLVPLVADMLECRQQFAEGINDMFGTDISVELSGAWKARQMEFEAVSKQMEDIAEGKADADNTENNGSDTAGAVSEDGNTAGSDSSVDSQ